MPHICVSELGQHCFSYWLVAWSAPSYYLNQCWNIVNWTLVNILRWNSNRNTKLFIHENAFENVLCEMATILSRGRWVINHILHTDTNIVTNLYQCQCNSPARYGKIDRHKNTYNQTKRYPCTYFLTCNTHSATVTVRHILNKFW